MSNDQQDKCWGVAQGFWATFERLSLNFWLTVARWRWPLTMGLALFFVIFAKLDIHVAGWFYDPANGFVGPENILLEFVRKGLPVVLFGILLFMILLWGLGKIFKQTFYGITGRITAYLFLALAVGPGLIVNALLKENWGRARPSQILEFGGQGQFSPPFMISDQCASNCSFVSGHAALGFWVVAFAFLAPMAWRGRALTATILFGALVGLVRMAQGGHFLSDVTFAGIITIWTSWLLYNVMLKP